MKKLFILALLCVVAPALASAEEPAPAKGTKTVGNSPTPKTTPQQTTQPTSAPAAATPNQIPPLYNLDSAAQPNPNPKSVLARILQSQHLRVCVRSDVPPFGYFSTNGITGFDVSLATELAVRLSIDYKKNLHVDWTVITAGARITSLQQKTCDIVVAAFSVTATRKKLVHFSEIYLQTDKVLVAQETITRKEPIIARVKGTTGKIEGIQGKTRLFGSYQEIIYAMENGDVDYIITDRPIALHMIRSVTKSYRITKTLAKNAEQYAVGVAQNNKSLLKAVNKALRDLARSGRLAYLHRQWL